MGGAVAVDATASTVGCPELTFGTPAPTLPPLFVVVGSCVDSGAGVAAAAFVGTVVG
jgi:hypothetical protein